MRVRLVHIDGKLPNLALMKLAHWHRAQGDAVQLTRSLEPDSADKVYASAIFRSSQPRIDELRGNFPDAVVGGTGSYRPLDYSVEAEIGAGDYEHYDYSVYPEYPWSLGFTQRGCRLRCGFCVVPEKEGKPRPVNSIGQIWRPGTPRNVLLLDNDFFGQPRTQWEARIDELRTGGFRVSFNQGVNIRLVDETAAAALASVRYYDDQFRKRRLYTAWDNLGQEQVFFRGLTLLQEAGIPARHLMVYMLVGYAPGETIEQVFYRYRKLVEAGCKPYPMVYDRSNRLLCGFQRWVIGRFHEFIPWADYCRKELKMDAFGPWSEAGPAQARLDSGSLSQITLV